MKYKNPLKYAVIIYVSTIKSTNIIVYFRRIFMHFCKICILCSVFMINLKVLQNHFTHIRIFINMNTSLNLDVDCDVGYYGKKCNLSCRYPNYGSLCQKRCYCSEMKCDHVYGCGNGINFKHICKKNQRKK